MINYDKTLWENNKTVVDADNLNNVENQLNILTNVAIDTNSRIQDVEDTLPMKANITHTHDDYALKEHTHEGFATEDSIEELSDNLATLNNNLEELKADLAEEFKKYFDDVTIEENILSFLSNGEVIKSIELPATSPRIQAICGDVLCGEALSGEGLELTRNATPTTWQDGVTPLNAENMNKIESKIVDLFELVEQIEVGGGSGEKELHIGNEEPTNKKLLWVDNSDEEPDDMMNNDVIEQFANILKTHSGQIKELFFLTDAYLDDGEFTDPEEPENILDGGIF